jgi:ADP-ribose pyrophosphatase
MVVPVTADGRILLIRQYRYAVDDWCLEVPAGGLHENASAVETARKELLEETGATCGRIETLAECYVSNSLMDELGHFLVAWDCVPGPKQELERAEFIELHPLPAAEAVHLARTGGITDAKSALAVLMAEPYLKKMGFL